MINSQAPAHGSQKTIFIISPIGSEKSPDRIYFDKVRRHIIDPVAEEMGYSTIRADEIPRPGTITKQIIDHLLNDDLVIADMTEKNPNVFYELAVRHAVGKPVILLGAIGDTIPFDLAAQRVIFYDLDPDNIENAKNDLKRQIQEVNTDTFIVDSPIEESIKFERIDRQPTKDRKENEILAILRNLSERILNIENNLSSISRTPCESPVEIAKVIPIGKQKVTIYTKGGPPDTTILITSTFHTAGSEVYAYLDRVRQDALLARGRAEPNGSFTGSFRIPQGTPSGTHYIWVKDVPTNMVEKVELNVT